MNGTVLMKGLVFVTERPAIEPEPVPEVQQEKKGKRRYSKRGTTTRAEQLRAAALRYWRKKQAERRAAKHAG